MKLRILSNGMCFKVQNRFLFFFWIDCGVRYYTFDEALFFADTLIKRHRPWIVMKELK